MLYNHTHSNINRCQYQIILDQSKSWHIFLIKCNFLYLYIEHILFPWKIILLLQQRNVFFKFCFCCAIYILALLQCFQKIFSLHKNDGNCDIILVNIKYENMELSATSFNQFYWTTVWWTECNCRLITKSLNSDLRNHLN